MKIFYEDGDIIVCEKPYGISSQKSGTKNMVDILSKTFNREIYPVHRLDTATEGIMVYAGNSKSAAVLSAQIANRLFEKEYICAVHGHTSDSGEMIDFIRHDRIQNKSFVTEDDRFGAKKAELEFQTIERLPGKNISVVKVMLHTGRTHQIRVQFAERGYVIYGDGKYGAKDNDRIALHSYKISFVHPSTKEHMNFISAPTREIYGEIALSKQKL